MSDINIDLLGLLPTEIVTMLLGHLGIAGWHNLSKTCVRMAAIVADNAKSLRTNVLTSHDLTLPIEVVRKHWDFQSSELILKSMKVDRNTIFLALTNLGKGFMRSHLTLVDCHVDHGAFDTMIPSRHVKLINCSGDDDGSYDFHIGGKDFWSQMLSARPGSASWHVQGCLPHMSMFLLCLEVADMVTDKGHSMSHYYTGRPGRPIKMVVEVTEAEILKEVDISGEERQERDEWEEKLNGIKDVIEDAILEMIRTQEKESAVTMTYQEDNESEVFKIVLSSVRH